MSGEKPSKAPVRRYEVSADMYDDQKIRQALEDGVKWEQIATAMFKDEKVEDTTDRRIGVYISTKSSSDSRRGPCGTCPVKEGSATEPLHNITVSARNAQCLTCLQITYGLLVAPAYRTASDDPIEDRKKYLYERGFFMVDIRSGKDALFVDPCVSIMWSRSRSYELVKLDDSNAPPEDENLASVLEAPDVQTALNQADEHLLPMALRSRVMMPDDFEGNVRWAKTQLDACGKDHARCVPPTEQLLPTRVLALETNDQGQETIRLLESNGIRSHYACLSHCWGGNLVLRTLRSNKTEHEQGIDYDSLGATFQDAVSFCRALGIKYCWIDALCIIQDDKDDWLQESASMYATYSNAYITLSATAALDGTRGFRKHANPEYHGVEVPSKPGTRVLCRPILDHVLFQERQGDSWGDYSHFMELPLLQRGWVYQERVLSPRVLHFGQELVWECNTLSICECSGSAAIENPWKALRSFPDASISKHAGDSVIVSETSKDKKNPWGDLIAQYTSLALTKPSDIFPALGGIAQRYGQANPHLGRYLAGLWEKTLLSDLFWRPKANKSEARLEQWRAPSWSWASQSAPVEFLVGADDSIACELISVTCDTKNRRDRYGELDPDGEATLTIRAPIVDVTIEYTLHNPDPDDRDPKMYWDPASVRPGAMVWHESDSKLVVEDDDDTQRSGVSNDGDGDSIHGSQDDQADENNPLKQGEVSRKDDKAVVPLATVLADTEKKHLGVCNGMPSFDIKPDAQFAQDVPSGSIAQLLMLTRQEGSGWTYGLLLAPSPTHPGKHIRIGSVCAMYGWSWSIPVDLWSVKEMRTVEII